MDLSTTARPFSLPEHRRLSDDDRPVFWIVPAMAGDIYDATAAATPETEKPVDQSAFCSECGERITVKVRLRAPGEIPQGLLMQHILARSVDRVEHISFDGVDAPWPADIADRVEYLGKLPVHWIQRLFVEARKHADLDPEEERGDSDSAQS